MYSEACQTRTFTGGCMQRKLIFLMVISLLLLWGCVNQQSQSDYAEETVIRKNQEPVTLSFWHTHNPEETQTLQELVADFQREFPHITVQMQQVPFNDALNKYKTVAQARKAPDVFRAEITWTTELASLGYLMSLDAFMNEELQQDFLPKPLATTRYDNHIWAVPQVTDCLALFYNKRLVPNPPETLEELVEIGKEVTQPQQDRYAFYYNSASYWLLPFIWSHGGHMLAPETLKVTIDQAPAIEAIQFLKDLRTKHKIVPAGMDFANDYNNMNAAFFNGQFAMIINGPWATAEVLASDEFKNTPQNFAVTRIPRGPAGYASPIGGHNFVMAANTEKVFASWELISFLSRPENQARFALKNNLLPTRQSAYELQSVQDNRILQQFKYVLDAGTTRPIIPAAGKLMDDLDTGFRSALEGSLTPAEAMVEVKKAWQEDLFIGVD